MAKNTDDREAREARARLRVYQARVQLHERQQRRRRSDNIWAVVLVVVVFGLAVGGQLWYFGSGPGAPVATASPKPSETSAAGQNTGNVPSPSLAEGRSWTGSMTINGIQLGFTLDGAAAPQAVSSTISLVKSDFYKGNNCHRLTTSGIYVLQCGDPKGDGTGGPGYSYGPIENAPKDNLYPAGTIAMARQSGNAYSQGSQFFLVYKDSTIPADSAGGYTVLGHITSGLSELQSLVANVGVTGGATDGKPASAITISSMSVQ